MYSKKLCQMYIKMYEKYKIYKLAAMEMEMEMEMCKIKCIRFK